MVRTCSLHMHDLVAHYEGGEQLIYFAVDGFPLLLRDVRDRDRSDAAMAAMRPHLNLTVDAFFRERGENAGEYAFGGVPSKLGLEHLADAGQRHRIDWDNLHGRGGAFGGALSDPRFQLARLDSRTRFQLHVAHRQLAGIGVRLTHHGGKAYGWMLEHDLLDRGGIDVVAATNDEILGAAGDPEVAILVETTQIPGVDPIPVHERTLVVDSVEIAAEDTGSSHDHDPDLVRFAIALDAIVGVQLDDANAAVGHREPDGPEADGTVRVSHGVDA